MPGNVRAAVGAVLLAGLLLLGSSPVRAQDAPPPSERERRLEQELRELRERVKRLEDGGLSPAPGLTNQQQVSGATSPGKPESPGPTPSPPGPRETPGQAPGTASPGSGASGPAAARAEGGPEGGPRAQPPGTGAVGPERQSPAGPERAPTLEDRLVRTEETMKKLVGAGLERVELHGAVDADYLWNLNDPRHRRVDVNRLRLEAPDHDTFSVAWAKLEIARPVSNENELDAGFRVGVAFGRLVVNTLSLDPHFLFGQPVNLAQAYVDLQFPTPLNPLLVRVGRFYNWFGVESLDTPLNPNFTLSYLYDFTPFTNTGVELAMDLGGGFRYAQFVVDGWDVVVDNNDAKTVGGQLSWTAKEPATTIALNWIWGPEQNENDKNVRQEYELDVSFTPIPGTTLLGALQYGQEEHASTNPRSGLTAKFGGAMAIFRQEFGAVTETFNRFAAAARVTWYRDEHGSKSGLDQTLVETTGTFEVHVTENARLRFEYRRDASSRDHFFIGRRGRFDRDHQDTVSMDASFLF